jgi:putative copper export protein
VTTALAVLGWLDLVASVTVVGGVLATAFVPTASPRVRRIARAAAVAVAAVLVLEFVLTTVRLSTVGTRRGAAVVSGVVAMRWGQLWLVRGLGLLVLGAALRGPQPLSGGWAGAAAVWLLARSAEGHAGAHGTTTTAMDWVHLVAVSAWVGALMACATEASSRTAVGVRRLATGAFGLIVPSGIYAALAHVDHVEQLWETAYGRTLLVKIAFVVALLGLGAVNHFRHVPRVLRGDEPAARALRRTVLFELGVGAVILFLSALLGVLPMPGT